MEKDLKGLSEFALERYTRYVIKPLARALTKLTREELRALVEAADEAELKGNSMDIFMNNTVGGMAMAVLKGKFGEDISPKQKALSE